MSLLLFDGFDGYDTIPDMYTYGGWTNAAYQNSVIDSTVRVGTGKCIKLIPASSVYATVKRPLPADHYGSDVYIGFALKLAAGSPTGGILSMNSSASNQQCYLNVLAVTSSTFNLCAYKGATLLATGTATINADTWNYVEIKVKVHNTSGIFDCKINGISDFTFSGNTRDSAASEFANITFTGTTNTGNTVSTYVDDLYVCNSTGSVNNTYLGEMRAEIITPTSDSSVAWTHNTGTSNWSAVDDAIGAPDDDTTYVSSSTSAARDEYGLSDLTVVATVAGVKVVTRAEKDDANPLSFKHGIKSGATDQQVQYSLGVGYSNFIDIFETSDGATTAFTPTTVNSLLSTIEVV